MSENEVQEQELTPFNFVNDTAEPGPRPGLGGWGMPGTEASHVPITHLGPILGYCLEKVIFSFGLLRDLTTEGASIQRSLQNLAVSLPGSVTKDEIEESRKKAKELFTKGKADLESGRNPLLVEIVVNEDELNHLPITDKAELLALLAAGDLVDNPPLQSAVMHILRNAGDVEEFAQLATALGGISACSDIFRDNSLGTFYATAERFTDDSWYPPFHHPIFHDEGAVGESSATEEEPLKALKAHIGEDIEPLINEEMLGRFLIGDIAAADLFGLSREELYMVAQRGYDMLQEGKLNHALRVFDGLVFLDPYDPYFYTVLGSVCQKKELQTEAIACYTTGITLQPWNINALANRGEILFNQGRLTDALSDFQRVLYYDPEDSNPSTVRTKALLLAIKESVEQKAQAEAPADADADADAEKSED